MRRLRWDIGRTTDLDLTPSLRDWMMNHHAYRARQVAQKSLHPQLRSHGARSATGGALPMSGELCLSLEWGVSHVIKVPTWDLLVEGVEKMRDARTVVGHIQL